MMRFCAAVVVVSVVLLLGVGCRPAAVVNKPTKKQEAWEKRAQVYTDKTPSEWLKLICHRDSAVRNKAVDALINYAKDGKDTVDELIVIVKGGSPDARLSASRALAGMSSKAHRAVPALCAALQDTRWPHRDAAAEALGRVARKSPDKAVPALRAALNDKDERVRAAAVRALSTLGNGQRDVVAALSAALDDSDANVRVEAVDALGRMGPQAKAAMPALQRIAQQGDFMVKQAAEEAIKAIQGESQHSDVHFNVPGRL